MVGGFVVQLATSLGAHFVAGVQRRDVEEAGQLGAEMTVDTGGELEGTVRGEWPEGVDACIDTVGLAADGVACVRDGGAFVTSVPMRYPARRGRSLRRPCRCNRTLTRLPGSRIGPRPAS